MFRQVIEIVVLELMLHRHRSFSQRMNSSFGPFRLSELTIWCTFQTSSVSFGNGKIFRWWKYGFDVHLLSNLQSYITGLGIFNFKNMSGTAVRRRFSTLSYHKTASLKTFIVIYNYCLALFDFLIFFLSLSITLMSKSFNGIS